MSIGPTSLANIPANSSSAYVPLYKKEKQKIEVPQDPQAELQFVRDLYEQASVPTFEEKAKAPYAKDVNRYGDITLEPNSSQNIEGPSYEISQNGRVLVKPAPYELPNTLDIQEQATDPKVIEEVQQLMAAAKPQEEIPEHSLEIGYRKDPDGEIQLLKKNIDGSNQSYTIRPDGSVTVYQYNEKTRQTIFSQQIIKPGELPGLKVGEERPVGQALTQALPSPEAEAPSSPEVSVPANGQVLNIEA